MENMIQHYGVKRRSGRYPYGSGDKPQRSRDILDDLDDLKAKGLNEKDRAAALGMSINKMRSQIAYANASRKQDLWDTVHTRIEDGQTPTEIGRKLDIPESTIRKYRDMTNPQDVVGKQQLSTIEEKLIQQVKAKGYLDVGPGVEQQLGISKHKMDTVVKKLEDEGYTVHNIYVPQVAGRAGNYTTVKTLSLEPDYAVVRANKEKIRPPEGWSDDGGLSFQNLKPIKSINGSKVAIVYKEDGGADRDGLMELRRGAKDLSLGNSKYAQVRIGVDDKLYLKGMAIYGDNLPPGKDIVFYTNKSKGTPFDKVLKPMSDNPDNRFGATIKEGGQRGHLNIVNEEGDWNKWSAPFSSQFLSKQPFSLVKERIGATLKDKTEGLKEILALTNPTVRKKMLTDYADGLDTAAQSLKMQSFPKTKSHVILPFSELKPNEIYAPNYKNGERVVLLRHPHGGKFELPEVTVNNRGSVRKILGDTRDAIGLHPSIASKMSGADFDGDSVLVIPNAKGSIKTEKSLAGLKDFDPNKYKVNYETIGKDTQQTQMGVVSNLITDMSLKGAAPSELARAVRHSMVVIDARKHNLDYKRSAADNGIAALQRTYQAHVSKVEFDKYDNGSVKPGGKNHTWGASTIISRSSKDFNVFDPVTKKKTLYKDPNTGKKRTATLMDLVDDAHKLSSGTPKENEYAKYANSVKKMAAKARAEAKLIKEPKENKEAARKYKAEVDTLNIKLNKALSNAPKERQAQILANKIYSDKTKQLEMSREEKKKVRSQSLVAARNIVGAGKETIKITDKEWDAIQNQAISKTKLATILQHADADRVKELATPRATPSVTSATIARANAYRASGYTTAEIAEALGVSVATISKALNGE